VGWSASSSNPEKTRFQRLNQFVGGKAAPTGRKSDNVGEENRDIVEAFRDDPDLLLSLLAMEAGSTLRSRRSSPGRWR